ncbi:MAG: hypothetical protein A4E62_02454 [Syntrophorhabdus sp. PtaU1.Bin002]|nr:MAG: hypothetical protein A4E62_02454 [Syntrophorhabdus sp. PtaU1.Bin002]
MKQKRPMCCDYRFMTAGNALGRVFSKHVSTKNEKEVAT